MFWFLVLIAVIVFLARNADARAKLARAVSGEAGADGRPRGHPSTWGWPDEGNGGGRGPRPLPDGRFRTVTGEEIPAHVAEAPQGTEQLVFEGGQVRTAAEVRAEEDEAKDRVKERWRAEQRTRREAGREQPVVRGGQILTGAEAIAEEVERGIVLSKAEQRRRRGAGPEQERPEPEAAAEPAIPAIVYAVESAPAAPEPAAALQATVFTTPAPVAVEERRRPAPAPVRVSIPAVTRDAPHPARPWDAARERAAARHAAMLAEARARHAAMLAEMRARHRERAERAA
jgi:hypothetical protein